MGDRVTRKRGFPIVSRSSASVTLHLAPSARGSDLVQADPRWSRRSGPMALGVEQAVDRAAKRREISEIFPGVRTPYSPHTNTHTTTNALWLLRTSLSLSLSNMPEHPKEGGLLTDRHNKGFERDLCLFCLLSGFATRFLKTKNKSRLSQ